MNHFINFNGTLLEATSPVAQPSNRSLRYGDGLFETMRCENGGIRLARFHFERLFQGLKVLEMEWKADFTADYLSGQIFELCKKNNQEKARIRLNVYREESPGFSTLNNHLQFIIESSGLPDPDPEPVRVTFYKEEKKSAGILSNLKTNNYLLYVMAAKHARQNGFDDALILNSQDRICEATTSNVFFIKDGIVFTPLLSEGCVAGVMRRHLLEVLPGLGFSVIESPISPEMIFEMDEGFLTNAIQGIKSIERIGDRILKQNSTALLIASLAEIPT